MVLKHHPNTLAYRESVSRLMGRHRNKDVMIDEARFQLRFKVQHRFPTKSEDCLFYGIKTEMKRNGVQFLHVELIGDYG
jgi:aspartate oxidase